MVKDGIVIKDKYKSNLDIKSEASTRSSTFSDVAVPAVLDAARREDLATPKPPAKVVSSVSGEWTAVQQESLSEWGGARGAVQGVSMGHCYYTCCSPTMPLRFAYKIIFTPTPQSRP